MSVCAVAFLQGGKTMVMGADSRASTIVNGQHYYLHDNATKLYSNEEGLIFYCSGAIELSEEVAKKVLEMEVVSNTAIINVLRETFAKHLKLIPELANMKHVLQFVIPFRDSHYDDVWRITYYDSNDNFEPTIYGAQPNQNFVFAIGTGAKIIHPIIDEGINQTGEVKVLTLYKEAFSAAADEKCGGTLSIAWFEDNDITVKRVAIPDKRELHKLLPHAAGDGVIVSPDNTPISGVATIEKPNGLWSFIYKSNNYARERRLIFQDNGLELSTETGEIVLGHDNGSYIKIKSSGDIEINAIGKITFNGSEYLHG